MTLQCNGRIIKETCLHVCIYIFRSFTVGLCNKEFKINCIVTKDYGMSLNSCRIIFARAVHIYIYC